LKLFLVLDAVFMFLSNIPEYYISPKGGLFMRRKIVWFMLVSFSSFLFYGCEDTESQVDKKPNWGDLDFTHYVAIGNSLTAGVSDGALYYGAQKYSFPNLIAKTAQIDDFEQPDMAGNGFSWSDTLGCLDAIKLLGGKMEFSPAGFEANRDLERPYNNLGIPLITIEQLYTVTTTIEADSNHFVDKILRNSGRTPIEEALFLDPTLITLWVGNNDLFEAATQGWVSQDYPSPEDFSNHLNQIIQLLKNPTNAPIFIANVVDITSLPYFTSVPPYVRNPVDSSKVYIYGQCEEGVRLLTDDDIVLFWALPQFFALQDTMNMGYFPTEVEALNDTLVLDATEKGELINLLESYNGEINTITAAISQLYLVDVHGLFQEIESAGGYTFESGREYVSDPVSFNETGEMNVDDVFNSLFSLDALHPSKYGYGAIANLFIEVMNELYGSEIPEVDVSDLQ